MDDREALEQQYLAAVYEVDLPGGRVVFRIGDAVAELSARPFALITGFNPGGERPSREENERQNRRLEEAARRRGATIVTARGRDAAGTHVEPSFALFDIAREEALALAVEFGQAAIVWFDGDRAELAWTTEAPPAAGP